ncbi:Rieske 2Fe-2S domain-containing protein [Polyangium jinanense]|uniref:Rieske 2Fe-2S domain-containing protein n=1 Tax=Polyangium jinanense TaxID=2829994 RepID=A0A9X3XD17_9BACT|nr:Rieske 2Fe-2S domain-containing protein [Polyangium jinanense]MDC3988419.1 Rieske 2Fe-2S domain-containing protein [Polyangium jinanense]
MAQRKQQRYDLPPYTEGWFQMGWSDDLAIGQLRQLRHFGRTYVMFRGDDGRVGILDDVCPHLGAHLSEGGCVRGNSVRCPYHHWAFDAGGRCTDIPYATKIPVKARIAAHSVVERYGMIFMYRNKAGTAPARDLPTMDDFDESSYMRPAKYEFEVEIHGQDIMENSVDSPHFSAVHGHDMPVNTFREEGHELRVTQLTSVRRFGTTLRARLEFHLIEPGFHYVHFPEMPGPAAHVFSSIVPVDERRVRHRLSLRIKRSPIPGFSLVARQFLLWQMMKTYREDMRIWQSKEYLPHPVLCEGDGSIMKLRAWYRQFFDPDEPSVRRLDVVPS